MRNKDRRTEIWASKKVQGDPTPALITVKEKKVGSGCDVAARVCRWVCGSPRWEGAGSGALSSCPAAASGN